MTVGQSRGASLFEALTSTVLGFILSVAVQRALFPAMGHDFALTENLVVASVFTAVSILRGYTVRRVFNALRDQVP
jgi:ABC-type spermidine/putrescine transport system permease subunit II